jgi:hypothetical protein
MKRLFPVLWFGFLAFFVVMAFLTGISGPDRIPFLLMPVLMAVFGFFLMKVLIFDLVDEVWDAGDYLLIRNKGEEARVRLDEIVNVSYSGFSSPKRATLRIRKAGRFGNEVTFVPVSKGWPFARNQMIDELIDRIDAARRGLAA